MEEMHTQYATATQTTATTRSRPVFMVAELHIVNKISLFLNDEKILKVFSRISYSGADPDAGRVALCNGVLILLQLLAACAPLAFYM